MAREDWEHLFSCAPSHLFSHERGGVFAGMGLFDKKEKTALLIDIFELLAVSPQRFMDILNSHKDSPLHLITNHELEFRQSGDEYYFDQETVFGWSDFTVHEEDFKTWLDENYRLLKVWQASEVDANVLAERLDYQDVVEGLEAEEAEASSRKGGEKPLTNREKDTLLKLIHAAVELGGKRAITDRGLAVLLANKTQTIYGEASVDENTVRNKLNDIKELRKRISN